MSGALLVACLVIAVSDGDSIKVRCPERPEAFSVRLAAVDAPEIAHKAFGIAEQTLGRESRDALASICLKKPATVDKVTTDRYGRMVANVECDGTPAGPYQVRHGYAWAYMVPPQSVVPALEAKAREERVGIWSLPADQQIPPWVWRKQQH